MVAAEAQIVSLIALSEPEWILASLVALGDSYGRLAEDLEASPTPRKLSAGEAMTYRKEIPRSTPRTPGPRPTTPTTRA